MNDPWQQFIPYWLRTATPFGINVGLPPWSASQASENRWPQQSQLSISDPPTPPGPSAPPTGGLFSNLNRSRETGGLFSNFNRSQEMSSSGNGGLFGSLFPPPDSRSPADSHWLQTAMPFGVDFGLPGPRIKQPWDYPQPHQSLLAMAMTDPSTLPGPPAAPPWFPPAPPLEHLDSARYWGAAPAPSDASELPPAPSFYLSPVPQAPSWDQVPTGGTDSTGQIFPQPPSPSSWGAPAPGMGAADSQPGDEFAEANGANFGSPLPTPNPPWNASPPGKSLAATWDPLALPIPSAPPLEDDPFTRAAIRTRQSVRPEGGRQEGRATSVLENYLPDVANQLATLPDRVTDALVRYNLTGEFDPGPFVETAMLLAGMRGFRARPPGQGMVGRNPELSGGTTNPAATRTAPLSNPPVKPQRPFELDHPQADIRELNASRSSLPNRNLDVEGATPAYEAGVEQAQARIEKYRSENLLRGLFGDNLGTVSWTKSNGRDIFGPSSSLPTYERVDREAANSMRNVLIRKYPDVMKRDNIGQKPNDALFHAETTVLLRAARENRGTLAGRRIEVHSDRTMCDSCEDVLPYLGLELGNPTVTFVDRAGRRLTMRNGAWLD